MNNAFADDVLRLFDCYSRITDSTKLFTPDESSKLKDELSQKVIKLVNTDRTQIPVYGIYNSCKSTISQLT